MISNLIVDQTTAQPGRRRGGQPRARLGDARGRVGSSSRTGRRTRGCRRRSTPGSRCSASSSTTASTWCNKGGGRHGHRAAADDDPLYDGPAQPHERFMTLPRATDQPVTDPGRLDDASTPTRPRRSSTRTRPTPRTPRTRSSCASTSYVDRRAREHRPPARRRRAAGWPPGRTSRPQARELLGIDLDDMDVLNVPLLVTDLYGQFTPGPNGYPQLVTADRRRVEGDLATPVSPQRGRGARRPATRSSTTSPTTRRRGAGKTADADIDEQRPDDAAPGRDVRRRAARRALHHRRRPRQREHRPHLRAPRLPRRAQPARGQHRPQLIQADARRSRPATRATRPRLGLRRPAVPGGALRDRDGVPAPASSRSSPARSAGDRPGAVNENTYHTRHQLRRSRPSSPTPSTGSATRC